MTAVVNAASYSSGPISPGESVAILGQYLGPDVAVAATVDPRANMVTTLAGVEVRFNGVLAPLFAPSTGLVTVVVPREVSTSGNMTLQLSCNGKPASPINLLTAETAPGLFSTDLSGSGPGTFLNEDGTLNTPENLAKAGSLIIASGTGGGQTKPPSAMGVISTSPAPLLPR